MVKCSFELRVFLFSALKTAGRSRAQYLYIFLREKLTAQILTFTFVLTGIWRDRQPQWHIFKIRTCPEKPISRTFLTNGDNEGTERTRAMCSFSKKSIEWMCCIQLLQHFLQTQVSALLSTKAPLWPPFPPTAPADCQLFSGVFGKLVLHLPTRKPYLTEPHPDRTFNPRSTISKQVSLALRAASSCFS